MKELQGGPPLILALMRHLPEPGTSWSPDKRRRFLAALEANVRLIYDIIPANPKRHPIRSIDPPY